jgi:hypothetical protein
MDVSYNTFPPSFVPVIDAVMSEKRIKQKMKDFAMALLVISL